MPTKSEIIVDSNLTYVPNTSGLITPQQVQTLNANWINASIFPEQTGSMSVRSAATASFLLGSVASASFSAFAVSASQSTSASFATTASFALNVPATSSFAISASFAQSASLATRNLITASAIANVLTFTKGDGTTFDVTVAQSGSVQSASFADHANTANSATSASYAFTASSAINSFNAISASYAFTASSATNAANSISASFATSASRAISAASATSATTATSALTSISASFATFAATAGTTTGGATLSGNNTFSGVNTFNNAVTMSNVQVNGTASIAFLNVVFQSSSVIYSSGSNQFGDASNDTQTLFGTVNVITGPLVVTGSANFASVITGSISTALNANTASYVANAFISASQVGGNDKVSLTSAAGTTTTLTIDNVANATNAASANTAISASFATTAGTANSVVSSSFATNAATASSLTALNQTVTITGSVNVSGSIRISQGDDLITHHVQAAAVNGVEIQNNTGNVVAQFGAGGGLGTTFYGQVNGTAFSGSGAQIFGVVSASFANSSTSASLAQLALTASYFDGLVASASYAILAETANTALTANTANSALTAVSADTASFLLGSVATASYAFTASGVQGINASAVNSTYYLGFVPNAEVNAISIDTDLSYNPSTGTLSINTINGSLNGNASTATTAASATSASYALSASFANNAGTASFFAGSVTSASFAQTSITASFATNFVNSGSYVITGSHRGNVVSQSIASSTASFDFSTGNFFTLNLTGSTLTHISASNIQAGQTVNVRITQGATTGSVSFSPAFDQVSGSAYVPTQVANAVDILTFITFDNSLIYVSNIKNLV